MTADVSAVLTRAAERRRRNREAIAAAMRVECAYCRRAALRAAAAEAAS